MTSTEDKSYLDKNYFIDREVYNCPFCNRNNVSYHIKRWDSFDWSKTKKCFVYFAECSSCDQISMHLSYKKIITETNYAYSTHIKFLEDIDIDSEIFYSVPTSFFVIDSRVPLVIRELIAEAEGCLKMNFMTGASACMRKAIYELLVLEKIDGQHYEGRIMSLKAKYANTDPQLFDILAHIQEMTSDKVHEQSWDEWDSGNLRLIIETLRGVLYEVYVLPKIKEERANQIKQLRENVAKRN